MTPPKISPEVLEKARKLVPDDYIKRADVAVALQELMDERDDLQAQLNCEVAVGSDLRERAEAAEKALFIADNEWAEANARAEAAEKKAESWRTSRNIWQRTAVAQTAETLAMELSAQKDATENQRLRAEAAEELAEGLKMSLGAAMDRAEAAEKKMASGASGAHGRAARSRGGGKGTRQVEGGSQETVQAQRGQGARREALLQQVHARKTALARCGALGQALEGAGEALSNRGILPRLRQGRRERLFGLGVGYAQHRPCARYA